MKNPIKIGIIGGSGLDDPDIVNDRKEKVVDTPFGKPSDVLIEGTIKGVACVLLARHGRKHNVMPGHVNYRANIWALKLLGCTHILASTACGSLKEEVNRGDIVILDSFVDRTHKRTQTFHDGTHPDLPGICHLPMHPAFCERTRNVLISCAKELNLKIHPTGVCVTIEGPRFSSRAESKLFKSWGCDVINMTTVPEVVLAKEAGLCYAAVALATDYDSWNDKGDCVSVGDVLSLFKENIKKVLDILLLSITKISEENWDQTIDSLKDTVRNNTMVPHNEEGK